MKLLLGLLALSLLQGGDTNSTSPPEFGTLRFTLEFRTQIEARTGVGFGLNPDLENPLFLTRIGAEYKPVHWLKLSAMGQDARAPLYGTPAPTSARDNYGIATDLHLKHGPDQPDQELLTQELRRQQAYLNQAQSLAHIGSWATNLATGQIHHMSDETLRVHGFDPHEGPVSLERFFNTLHPEDEPAVRALLENAVRTRTDYDIRDFRICRPVIRFLRTMGHHDPSQEIGEYIGVTADITERKRAEEEHERLRQPTG